VNKAKNSQKNKGLPKFRGKIEKNTYIFGEID
jgi:hypothetical protein